MSDLDVSSRITALQVKVCELERKLNFVMEHLKLEYKDEPITAALEEAAHWLKKGNRIEAIKVYQNLTGKGLKESKDAVDALASKLGVG